MFLIFSEKSYFCFFYIPRFSEYSLDYFFFPRIFLEQKKIVKKKTIFKSKGKIYNLDISLLTKCIYKGDV